MEETNSDELPREIAEILLKKSDIGLDKMVEVALKDDKIMRGLLRGLKSKNDVLRYNCFKILNIISESQPEILITKWNFFIELLKSKNSYHRNIAINIIANLTKIDAEKRFDNIFDMYFNLLNDESMITSRYLARNAGKIVKSKPHLQKRITEKLLDINSTHHDQKRKDLIMADIIQSFEQYFEVSDEKKKILSFVEKQLKCSSPKTVKTAKIFLKKFGS